MFPTVDDEWEKGDDLKPRINLEKVKVLWVSFSLYLYQSLFSGDFGS